jgi:4-carboxymuconolactone decarboxylase
MSSESAMLGGRLPLAHRESLSPAQRELFDQMMMMTVVPGAQRAHFQARTDDGQLIGPFNPALLSPAIASSFLQWQLTEVEHTSLSERPRQAVILTVGAVWQAAYELYAHSAVARQAGLSDDAIRALAGGGLPADLSDEEKVAQRIARALSTGHRINESVYREAEAAFGTRGVMDIVLLVGIYHTVCAMLNAFEIPAHGKSKDGSGMGWSSAPKALRMKVKMSHADHPCPRSHTDSGCVLP